LLSPHALDSFVERAAESTLSKERWRWRQRHLALADDVCSIHTIKSRELIRELEANGFKLISVRGSHYKFRNAANITIVVPHPKKDLGKGLVAALRKEAGLK